MTVKWSGRAFGHISRYTAAARTFAALTLDFLTSTSLSSNITFSRGTQATLMDSTGKITYAPNNLLTNSESFEAGSWNKVAATVTANTTVAPDGTTTADALVEDGTTAAHYVQQFISYVAGVSYIFSVYLKAGIRSWVEIDFPSSAFGTAQGGYFNLSGNGSLGNVTGAPTARTITPVGNGWYRVSVTATATATAGGNTLIIAASANGTTSYAGSNGSTALSMWGAEVEAVTYQTTPSTYNSTTPKNLLGYTQEFDNAAWTKTNAFVQTNLLTYSQDFDNAAWASVALSIAANSASAPNGTTTADNLRPTTASAQHYTQSINFAQTASTVYTTSVYAKAAGYNFLRIGPSNTTAVTCFNLSNGTISAETVAGAGSITPVGDGWYRCSVTFTATASGSASVFFSVNNASSTSTLTFAGDGTSGILLWGAQAVQGATAGDYQPTYAAAAAVQYAAPDGTLSADKLVETTATGAHAVGGSAGTIGTTETLSVYAKAAGRTWVTLQLGAGVVAYYDVQNGVLGSVTGGTATITSVGNGWYRCAATGVRTTNSNNLIYSASANNTVSYTGDGTSGIYIWGAQLSNSASLDPYAYNPGAAPTSAAYYGPRFDYDPVTLAPKGLLIEEQRSNLLTYSQQIGGTNWTSSNVTATTNNAVAPDGTTTATLVTENTATSAHSVYGTVSTFGTVTCTASVYIKAGTRRYVSVRAETTAASTYAWITFDTQNGTINANASVTSSSAVSVGNGWWRVTLTWVNATATADCNVVFAGSDVSTAPATSSLLGNSYTGTSSTFYVWGAQVEAGAFATSYIPTVASTVTRSADVATMLGTNFSSWYNQNEGTFAINFTPDLGLVSNTNRVLAVSQGGATARVIDIYPSGTNWANYNGTNATVIGAAAVTSTPQRIGAAYKTVNYGYVLNGGTVATDSASLVNAPTQMAIGNTGGVNQLNGHIRTLSYYNTRLTNTQLQALTA